MTLSIVLRSVDHVLSCSAGPFKSATVRALPRIPTIKHLHQRFQSTDSVNPVPTSTSAPAPAPAPALVSAPTPAPRRKPAPAPGRKPGPAPRRKLAPARSRKMSRRGKSADPSVDLERKWKWKWDAFRPGAQKATYPKPLRYVGQAFKLKLHDTKCTVRLGSGRKTVTIHFFSPSVKQRVKKKADPIYLPTVAGYVAVRWELSTLPRHVLKERKMAVLRVVKILSKLSIYPGWKKKPCFPVEGELIRSSLHRVWAVDLSSNMHHAKILREWLSDSNKYFSSTRRNPPYKKQNGADEGNKAPEASLFSSTDVAGTPSQ
ncbi:hypothetical protein BV25DRAFT_1822906 [Artomyces pyxidatus]|uniref:Uncharacterized protein n=1 Tax=Artomyces pyxidatus TaxID=48021 RepID=A0ACB8T8E7_9AGAM|nr:hypothetical protein BV25DRAFT_1822906 [Artomyces pyxidatus]